MFGIPKIDTDRRHSQSSQDRMHSPTPVPSRVHLPVVDIGENDSDDTDYVQLYQHMRYINHLH